jgi:hypothetical protein
MSIVIMFVVMTLWGELAGVLAFQPKNPSFFYSTMLLSGLLGFLINIGTSITSLLL